MTIFNSFKESFQQIILTLIVSFVFFGSPVFEKVQNYQNQDHFAVQTIPITDGDPYSGG